MCRNDSECECFSGCLLVILNTANAISEVTKCYPVNGQNYCFYTDGSVLSWNEAREFCARRNSTLPIIIDQDIDDVFQQFIQEVNDSVTWLDAHARHVNQSVNWHWINGQPSGNCTLLNEKCVIPVSIFLFYFHCIDPTTQLQHNM